MRLKPYGALVDKVKAFTKRFIDNLRDRWVMRAGGCRKEASLLSGPAAPPCFLQSEQGLRQSSQQAVASKPRGQCRHTWAQGLCVATQHTAPGLLLHWTEGAGLGSRSHPPLPMQTPELLPRGHGVLAAPHTPQPGAPAVSLGLRHGLLHSLTHSFSPSLGAPPRMWPMTRQTRGHCRAEAAACLVCSLLDGAGVRGLGMPPGKWAGSPRPPAEGP